MIFLQMKLFSSSKLYASSIFGQCKLLILNSWSSILKVVVAKEAVGDLGCLVRQLSLDQFENESRRMHPSNNDQSYPGRRTLNRQRSPQGLHKKVCPKFTFSWFCGRNSLFLLFSCRLFRSYLSQGIGELLLIEPFFWILTKLASYAMLPSRFLCKNQLFYN